MLIPRWCGVLWLLCGFVSAPGPAAATPRLVALEEQALVDPRLALQGLAALRDEAGVDAVEIVAQMGLIREKTGDSLGLNADLLWLQQSTSPLAKSVAALISARFEQRRGANSQALLLLAEAERRLPVNAPAWLRQPVAVTWAAALEAAGRIDEAVAHYLRAIELADGQGVGWRSAMARQTLAFSYVNLGQLETARRLLDEAARLLGPAGPPVVAAMGQNVEAYLREESGDRAGALIAQRRALALAKQSGSAASQALMLGNLADHFLRQGDGAQALIYAQQSMPLAKALDSPDALMLALANRGLARLLLRQFAEGKQDLADALAIDERRGDIGNMSRLLWETGRMLERMGDLSGAWEAYQRYQPLADQVLRKEQQDAILVRQETFDREQRDRELEALQQAGVLQAEAVTSKTLRLRLWWLAAAVGGLLLVVVTLIVSRLRETNRALNLANRGLQQLSEVDPLTGLANRHRLLHEMNERARRGPLEAGVFLLDIDHFKRINDHFGHAAGDAVLVELAHRLRRALRPDDLAVRWGGEEFLVVAPGLARADTEGLANRLLQTVGEAPVPWADSAIGVSVSIGFARFPIAPGPVAMGWAQAVDLVDAALYLAKAHGRNRGYGVLRLQAHDTADLAGVMDSLEASHASGQVDLLLLLGPAVQGVKA